MFCRNFCVFWLMFVNAFIWSCRRARHQRRCFWRYQKRSKTLACFHHDRFSFSNEEEASRKKFFARESRTRVELEARALLWEEEEKEKKEKKKKRRRKTSSKRSFLVSFKFRSWSRRSFRAIILASRKSR